ncbi:MAG: response regulator, partial [Myxococcales bacterium]|nr:response regulator [Myxococcales bacterium]
AIRRAFSRTLQVSLAEGVEDALEAIAKASPDIILCDVMMPGGGGAELWRRVTKTKPALAKKMIFVTGGATDEGTIRFLATQSQPVLAKPVDPRALLEAIGQLAKE